ncbi:MAG TPA: penicillin-binding protein activator LpoB [Burkholderiales bacterium]|nr:penicillin-binding protein activator LpoB [Burkholderiales bacterium]
MRILIIMLLAALAAAGCSTTNTSGIGTAMDGSAKWVMLPILNHTDVPQAGLRAEAITEALLRSGGVNNFTRYPAALNQDTLFEPAERKVFDEANKWARSQGARYAIYGAVDEWRYKVGIDGEPAVGVALHIMDLQTGNVVWSGVGGKSGWSRESLSGVAQKLIRGLLASANIRGTGTGSYRGVGGGAQNTPTSNE